MGIIYILYLVLAIIALVLNIIIYVQRIQQKGNTQLRGISDEHYRCLNIHDVLLIFTCAVIILNLLQDIFTYSQTLCSIAGFLSFYVVLVLSWESLMTAIVLYEKEKYSLQMKAYQGMTPKIVVFINGAVIVISAALIAINYAPIIEFDRQRRLLCIPITFPNFTGSEYTKLLIVLTWCGLASTWACVVAWFVYLLRNRTSVRYVTECHKPTKKAGLQVVSCLACWTVVVSLLTVYYWISVEDLLAAAILFSLLYAIGHPVLSLITHWLGGFEEEAGLSRDIPRRLTHVAPLTYNPNKDPTKFHSKWMGKFNEKVQAVVKVYRPHEKSKWMRETKAMALLRKTEHPNIIKYLWAGKGGCVKFSEANLSKDVIETLADSSNRMVCVQFYEHRSLRELLLHRAEIVTESLIKYISMDIALALVHLRQLHIVHNNINSKAIFIKSTLKSKMVTAMVGEFEQSDHVTLDHHRCERTSAKPNQIDPTSQLDNKFAADIRNYALLLLELVAAWNKHNGQPLKVSTSKCKTEVLVDSPLVQQPLKNPVKARTPTKVRKFSVKPAFHEIEEEPQSSLQQQTIVAGEEVAIEMDSTDKEKEIYTDRAQAIGVIIPSFVTDLSYSSNAKYVNHATARRRESSSACSTDSGYPRSLQSSYLPYKSAGLTPTAGKQIRELTDVENVLPGVHLRSQLVGNVQLAEPTINNNVICTNAMADYMRAKNSLPEDITAEYEQYDIPEGFALPEEKPNVSDCTLTQLAEKVTQDIDVFLKSPHSRSNSDASSLAPPRLKSCDAASPVSDISNLTFSSSADVPLQMCFNKELYIDKFVSSKQQREFLHRSGITKAQLYYSKELASMYDIVTPQLLYHSQATTSNSMKAYRSQLHTSIVNKMLLVSETCWIEDPVRSADSILVQLRGVFSVSQSMS